jgi:lon-related putative ATP-dependent protease
MPTELTAEQLRHVCDPAQFDFVTTAELSLDGSIIGQARGTAAIEFGIGMRSHGYNIYVLGETGTGRTTAIRRFLEEKTSGEPVPPDWVYVHNAAVAHQPRAIALPPGEGARLKSEMVTLVERLKGEIRKAFDSEGYRDTLEQLRRQMAVSQNVIMQELQQKVAQEGFTLVNTPSGLTLGPMVEGQLMPPEAFHQLPLEQRRALEEKQQTLNAELEDALHAARRVEMEAREEIRRLDRQVAAAAAERHFGSMGQSYAGQPEVAQYVAQLQDELLDHLGEFLPADEGQEEPDLRRYEVNLLVDNSATEGAPVIIESNPTYYNLFGRIEYELRLGVMSTHFTNIKPGSLHRANGGYLVLAARDLMRNGPVWEALKRAIKDKKIVIQSPDHLDGGQATAKSLDPQPIPLDLKIILMGSPSLYYLLVEQDEEFGELFKVKADFDTVMERDPAHVRAYAHFVAARCHDEGLREFDREAVAQVVEYGSRLAGRQDKLSARFGHIADLVREANYWAGAADHPVVTADDVRRALGERERRANLVEEKVMEEIQDRILLIATEGSAVGQVNGLSVLDLGDYAFGHPTRITARSFMGEDGVIHIEREVELAGAVHNKGVLTLAGYLGGNYAGEQPLSLSASVTFEQTYGGVDGDSASMAEALALISSIGNIPLKQEMAVTGSINQQGEAQPIGGATEKVEGFFAVCQARGLTGNQGVIIPAANVESLMLKEEVVAAVRQGHFHVWAVTTIDQAIELMSGRPAGERNKRGNYPRGTVHHAAQSRLLKWALSLKAFGDND